MHQREIGRVKNIHWKGSQFLKEMGVESLYFSVSKTIDH